VFVKAGCGKTARPVCAADGGQRGLDRCGANDENPSSGSALQMLMSGTIRSTLKYHTRIQKGGALLDEMRLLARSWQGRMSADRAGAPQSILGKKTRARSRDTLIRGFVPRFLHGDPPQAMANSPLSRRQRHRPRDPSSGLLLDHAAE